MFTTFSKKKGRTEGRHKVKCGKPEPRTGPVERLNSGQFTCVLLSPGLRHLSTDIYGSYASRHSSSASQTIPHALVSLLIQPLCNSRLGTSAGSHDTSGRAGTEHGPRVEMRDKSLGAALEASLSACGMLGILETLGLLQGRET